MGEGWTLPESPGQDKSLKIHEPQPEKTENIEY